jgi:hypothetical protein
LAKRRGTLPTPAPSPPRYIAAKCVDPDRFWLRIPD